MFGIVDYGMGNLRSVQKALETAVDFTYASMEKTLEDPDRRWYGVNFEEALPELIRMMNS